MEENKELFLFSASMKKIKETENDYELITQIDPRFQGLSKENLNKIEEIVLKTVIDIQKILKTV